MYPLSITVGCGDHNLILIKRKSKIGLPTLGQMIIIKQSFRCFNETSFCFDIDEIKWLQLVQKKDADKVTNVFNEVKMLIMDKHAPLRRMTHSLSPWLDPELREYEA